MRKIMFNDKYGLTASVLAGAKTQTRRIIDATPDEPLIGYGTEDIEPKPLPAKLANFLRLCDEAVKRNMHYHYDVDANSDRWLEAYLHKDEQVKAAMHDIKGGNEYYDVVLLSTHSTHPVITAAINGAKTVLIELNQDSHE